MFKLLYFFIFLFSFFSSLSFAISFSESPSSDGSLQASVSSNIYYVDEYGWTRSSSLFYGYFRYSERTTKRSYALKLKPGTYSLYVNGHNLEGGQYPPKRIPKTDMGKVEILRDELGLQNTSINIESYEIYYGDFNNDGLDGDIYLYNKPYFIFVGADILTPIKLGGGPGFVFYQLSEVGVTGFKEAELLSLNDKDLLSYQKAKLNTDYFKVNFRGDAKSRDLFIRGKEAGLPALTLNQRNLGLPNASTPNIDIYERFDPSDRRNHIEFRDENNDGVDDLVWVSQPSNIVLDIVYTNSKGRSDGTYFVTSSLDEISDVNFKSTTHIGQLTGQFKVDERGAATYSIPIDLPTGTAGMTPSVGLNYSSQSGEGLLGRGWSLSSYDAISRCSKNLFLDGTASPIKWNTDDRFCYNGQRLLLKEGSYGRAGSIYVTQNFSKAIIQLHGNKNGEADYFSRISEDGAISYFGYDRGLATKSNSKQQFASGKTLQWAESLTMDNMKNSVVYSYKQNLGNDFRLEKLSYAYGKSTKPNTSVKFTYQKKPNIKKGYFSGVMLSQTLRLKNIEVYNTVTATQNNHKNENIRSYYIYYNKDYNIKNAPKRSLIVGIQECVIDKCRAATKFDWNTVHAKQETQSDIKLIDMGKGFKGRDRNVTNYNYFDINGDGNMDIVWSLTRKDDEPFNSDYDALVEYAINIDGKFVQQEFVNNGNNKNYIFYTADNTVKVQVLDYNADGKQDIAVYGKRKATINGKNKEPRGWHVFLSVNQHGKWQLSGESIYTHNNNPDTVFSDVNGDGLTDMLTPEKVYYLLSNYDTAPSKYNEPYYPYKFAKPVSLEWLNIPSRVSTHYQEDSLEIKVKPRLYGTGDFNGDGRLDILASDFVHSSFSPYYEGDVPRPYERIYVLVQTNKGFEFFADIGKRYNKYAVGAGVFHGSSLIAEDINADGLTDIVFRDTVREKPKQNVLDVFLSTGTAFLKQEVPFNHEFKDNTPQLVDLNFDGFKELLWNPLKNDKGDKLKLQQKYAGLLIRWDTISNKFDHAKPESVPLSGKGDVVHAFIDINSDGINDVVRFQGDELFYGMSKFDGLGIEAITGIQEGLKPKLELLYEPLNKSKHFRQLKIGESPGISCVETASRSYFNGCNSGTRLSVNAFYERLREGLDTHGDTIVTAPSAALLFQGGYYVVTEVKNKVPYNEPQSNTSTTGGVSKISEDYTKTTYHYNQAFFEGWRGFLGFKALSTIDHQTGIKTTTEYSLAYPYQGRPISTYTRLSSGSILSESHNIYRLKKNISKAKIEKVNSSLSTLGLYVQPGYATKKQGVSSFGQIKLYTKTAYDITYSTYSGPIFGTGTYNKKAGENVPPACLTNKACPEFSNAYSKQSILRQVITDVEVDDDLNLSHQTVKTMGPLTTQTISTSHDFPKTKTLTLHGHSFTYSELGRIETSTVTRSLNGIEEPNKKIVNFEYHTNGIKSGMLKQDTTVTNSNKPLAETLTTSYDYDSFGNIETKSYQGWNGKAIVTRSTKTQYDDSGRFVTIKTDPLNNNYEQIKKRNKYGAPTRIEGVNGFDTETAYDTWGTEQKTTTNTNQWESTYYAYCNHTPRSPISCPTNAHTVKYQYDSNSGSDTVKSAMFYDPVGREIQALTLGFDGKYIAVDKEYDIRGRPLRISTPYFKSDSGPTLWTVTKFDVFSNPLKAIEPNGSVTKMSYLGNQTTTINDTGYKKIEIENSLGQIVQSIDDNNTRIEYEYTIDGELSGTTIIDGTNNAFSFGEIKGLCKQPTSNLQTILCYDRLGRKTQMWDPDKGHWLYFYNAFGELIKQTNSNGHSVFTDYDNLSRPIKRSDERSDGTIEGTTTWYYDYKDDIGQIVENAQLKLTAVVYTKDGTVSYGNGSNYVVRPLYDTVGREVISTTSMPDGNVYETRMKYDEIGRLEKEFSPLNGLLKRSGQYVDIGVQHHYNKYGQLYKTTNLEDGRELYHIQNMDARGQLRQAKIGGLVEVKSAYYSKTGLLKHRRADVLNYINVQNLSYNWDNLGNLTHRHNTSKAHGANTDLKESFCYDNLNRLVKAQQGSLTPSCDISTSRQTTVEYDNKGNILYKSDVGRYSYALKGVNYKRAGPHAATQIGRLNLQYDASGNMLSDGERSFVYSTFDKPITITKNNHTTAFKYGPNRKRFYRKDTSKAGTQHTWYLGNVEKIVKPSGRVEWRRQLPGGGMHTYHTDRNGVEQKGVEKRFILKDHLGSTDVILNASTGGNLVEQTFSFDSWGQRRQSSNIEAFKQHQLIGFDNSITHQGFTGHEMLDAVGVVHMNGRIYDARLGRFLQADPHIDGVTNTQGYNRYSYVQNNPLNAVDPSGYFALTVFAIALDLLIVNELLQTQLGQAVFQVGACFVGGPLGCAAAASFVTLYNGGGVGDALLAGAIAGISGEIFNQIGLAFPEGGQGIFQAGSAGHIAAHGFVGGVTSVIGGGKFGHGFASAGVSKFVGSRLNYDNLTLSGDIQRTLITGLVGGTTSKLTGGKFVNGAVTAAMAQILNGNRSAKLKAARGKTASAQKGDQQGRALTTNEIEAAKKVYGDTIDYSQVRIISGKYFFLQGKNTMMAPNGNIYDPRGGECADYTSCQVLSSSGARLDSHGTFIHEMGHIAQHQAGVNVFWRGLGQQLLYRASFGLYNPYSVTQGSPPPITNIEAFAEYNRRDYCSDTGACNGW